MIKITETISLSEHELHEEFVRSSGPGGQNVNKVATAVKLRFDVRGSPSLPDDVRERLIRLAGKRVTEDGILIIDARRFRTQERNRQDAVDRLAELIRKAAEKPRPRRRTRPPLASKRRRMDSKRRRSNTKRMRRFVSGSED
ncbi:MAG TPA: aminoacyl-tRNA hydrolase [Desulfobacterales bacterium]|nr:aminoacyl-tRNA hydrolase [Desulfobacterales bacterium]